MLLTDVTKILRVLLGAFTAVASPDKLTQRRISQIGQVIGAVEEVSVTEASADRTVIDKRVDEAHDIIHRVAAILAMEAKQVDGEGDGSNAAGDDLLPEVAWDGKTLEGETIELNEDEE